MPGDMLICSTNEATTGTTNYNLSHQLIKFTIINPYSPQSIIFVVVVLISQIANGDLVEITT